MRVTPTDLLRSSSCSANNPTTTSGGCCFAENGELDTTAARLFWEPRLDPTVIVARAIPARDRDQRSFNLFRQSAPVAHLSLAAGGEELLIGRGAHSIRLSVVNGTLLAGPVMLHVHLRGADDLDRSLGPLARLAHYLRCGRIMAPRPRTDLSVRRARILEVLDGLAVGSSQRDIARKLFGSPAVEKEWNGVSDHMRSRTRRLVAHARRLISGDYIDILAASAHRTKPHRL